MSGFEEFDPAVENEPLEAYCVSCKTKVEMMEPHAVWTSKGTPGTRGICPLCGGNIFRMGRTYLHGNAQAPEPVVVVPAGVKKARAVYIAADITQSDFAQQLGEDLKNVGVYVWVDDGTITDTTAWSTGVHPALDQCKYLVVVWSSFAGNTSSVEDAWRYFLSQRKKITIAQAEAAEPPDELRSRPRFDFSGDYKSALRGLIEALSR